VRLFKIAHFAQKTCSLGDAKSPCTEVGQLPGADLPGSFAPRPIVSAERVEGGLAVEFSDGKVVFYSSDFLFKHRADSGTRLLVGESDEDWSG